MSGQIKAGVNLMLAYFFLHDWQNFERADSRIKPLVEKHGGQSMSALYHWLVLARDMRSISTLDAEPNSELSHYFEQLDHPVQHFVNEAAKTVGIVTRYSPQKSGFRLQSVQQYFPVCHWDKYKTLSFQQIMQFLKDKSQEERTEE